MAAPTPTIITGTGGVGSVSINGLLYDCVMGGWRGDAQKQYFSSLTFCSAGWRDEVAGIKAIDIFSVGFLFHGNAISDPLLNFGVVSGVPCVWQSDTGCQITGTFHIDPNFGANAGAQSEFGVRARSKQACASTWNTTT